MPEAAAEKMRNRITKIRREDIFRLIRTLSDEDLALLGRLARGLKKRHEISDPDAIYSLETILKYLCHLMDEAEQKDGGAGKGRAMRRTEINNLAIPDEDAVLCQLVVSYLRIEAECAAVLDALEGALGSGLEEEFFIPKLGAICRTARLVERHLNERINTLNEMFRNGEYRPGPIALYSLTHLTVGYLKIYSDTRKEHALPDACISGLRFARDITAKPADAPAGNSPEWRAKIAIYCEVEQVQGDHAQNEERLGKALVRPDGES